MQAAVGAQHATSCCMFAQRLIRFLKPIDGAREHQNSWFGRLAVGFRS